MNQFTMYIYVNLICSLSLFHVVSKIDIVIARL